MREQFVQKTCYKGEKYYNNLEKKIIGGFIKLEITAKQNLKV